VLLAHRHRGRAAFAETRLQGVEHRRRHGGVVRGAAAGEQGSVRSSEAPGWRRDGGRRIVESAPAARRPGRERRRGIA
jgi:hypothetical protein